VALYGTHFATLANRGPLAMTMSTRFDLQNCGGTVQEMDELVERMVIRVWDAGGNIEHLRGAAAERLQQAGDIGAFLRYSSEVHVGTAP
jgi:hypothetical protein